jgi:hypothetical protein
VNDIDQSAAEKAGFTGEGFTGGDLTPGPAQGAVGDLDGAAGDVDDDFGLGHDPLMGEASEKKSAKGMLIIVLVVGLAAGSLFSMHTLTKVTAASGRNLEIDATVDKFLKSMSGAENPDVTDPDLVSSHNEIVEVLTNNYTESQVQLDRNPFEFSEGGGGDTGGGSTSRSAVERAFAKLDLKSVIGGSRPLANINGKIVRVNQVMPVRLSKKEGEIKFRVTSITREAVTVEAVGVELEEPFIKKLMLKRRR